MNSFNKHILLKLLLALFTMLTSLIVNGQVGVNNDAPDQFSVMDIQSSNMGVLIPRITTSQRFSITTDCAPNCPNGLMVFDTDKKAFFYYYNNNWFLINPFFAPDATNGKTEDIYTNDAVVRNVGIRKSPVFPNKLDVEGKYQVGGTSNYDTLLNEHGILIKSGDLKVDSGQVLVSNGNIKAPLGTASTTTFSSDINTKGVDGAIPVGGIVIWSGTIASIPKGWALCDGSNGRPDLRERFVVGAGSSDNTTVPSSTYSVGATGGENTHVLTVAEMPSHSHTGKTSNDGAHDHKYRGYRTPEDYDCAGCHRGRNTRSRGQKSGHPAEYGGEAAGSHSHTATINDSGADASHENRPPYYALAYIIKL